MKRVQKRGLFAEVAARGMHRIRAGWAAAPGLIGLTMLIPALGVQAAQGATASGDANLCRLLTQVEVSRVLKVTIVRAEALDTDQAGCEFSIRASQVDASAGHYTQLAQGAAAAHGATIDGPTEKLIDSFAKGIFQGSDSEKSATAAARHAGEVPVFSYAIQPGDAEEQMRLTRRTMAGISPQSVKTVIELGDEAFDTGGAMLSVRKGKTMIQFTYKSCACTTKDVVPLARKVVDAL
jgi:hypothetical protein